MKSTRRIAQIALPLLVLLILLVMPKAGLSPNMLRLLFITAVWTTTSIGWNLLGGLTGQVSFGFAVFYGLGAYTTALMMHAGNNPYFSYFGAAAVAMIASFLIGLPAFRLRGPYFAIATIGVTEAVRVVMNNLDITGGSSGYRIAEEGPFRPLVHYYSAVLLLAFAVAVSYLVFHSKFGLALRAIKQDEDAAADIGVNPYLSKLWIHAIAAALTGVAGGVYARYALFIYPGNVFAFQTSIYILLMPVIGGIGTVWGAILGGVVFGIVEEELVAKFPNVHLLLYGGLLIIIILLEPDGLLGLLRRLFRRRSRENPGSGSPDQELWGRGSLKERNV